jgi:putative RecB family exonuclease
MPVRLYPCTPTRLLTWLDCPRRYRFAYLDRPQPPKGPPWAHNSIGAAVHSALADWFALPVARRTPAAAPQLVRKRWLSEGFRDAEQSAQAADRAVDWVRDYLAGVDPAIDPVGVERTVSTPTRTLVLSGRVDRIDDRPAAGPQPGTGEDSGGAFAGDSGGDAGGAFAGDSGGDAGGAFAGVSDEDDEIPPDPGGLVIVDYKTGRYVPDADDARSSLALGVYAVAAARTLRRPCFRVELHHLPSATRAVAQHSPAGLERKVAQAESIAADCSRADESYRAGASGADIFPPITSKACSWCDFRRHCPEGQAAAPDREPWSAVLPD